MSIPMPSHTLILSDLHLGRPSHAAISADALRPLWQGFERLILNGDIAEVHHPEHRVKAAWQAMRVIDLCEEDGIELVLLSGNHDPFISDHRKLSLANGQLFITHGDVFLPAVAPWSPNASKLKKANREALAALEIDALDDLERRLKAAQHASHAEWDDLEAQNQHSTIFSMLTRPWSVFQVLWHWRQFPKIVSEFAATHDIESKYIVTGHTHHQGIWTVDDRVIINTGSFGFPGKPLGVALRESVLSVHDIHARDGERYELATDACETFQLTEVNRDDDTPTDTGSPKHVEKVITAK